MAGLTSATRCCRGATWRRWPSSSPGPWKASSPTRPPRVPTTAAPPDPGGAGPDPAYHGRVSRRRRDPPMTDEELRQLLLDTKVIAVVGLSANPDRASNQVAWYLHHQG